MRATWHRLLAPLTPGVRVLLFVLSGMYLAALIGGFSHAYDLYPWLGLSGSAFWNGRVWQVLSYSLLPAGIWDFLINIVLPTIAVILFWKYRGATPGKMAISARIVDATTGEAPSTGKLVVRYVAYLVSMLPLFLGFVWIGIDRRKQAFHDKIAGTVVIYEDD